MSGFRYDEKKLNEEIDIINEILSEYDLQVTDHKICYYYVKYLVELNYKSDISALLSLKLNIGMALESDNIRVYIDDDCLVIEKKRQNSYLYFTSYNMEGWWSNIVGARILLGQDEDRQALFTDLTKAPHVLIAGAAGSGKTNFLMTTIVMLMSKTGRYPLILDGSKQRLSSIFRAVPSVYSCGSETNFRKLYDINLTLRSRIAEHNEKELSPMFVIVNNIEDLISQKPDAEILLANLLEFGEKAGIHMILCMENMETGAYIKRILSLIPVRICFKMKNAAQSLMVLDTEGAESLFGNGDMLFLGRGSDKPIRVQSTYFSDSDVKRYASIIESANRK